MTLTTIQTPQMCNQKDDDDIEMLVERTLLI